MQDLSELRSSARKNLSFAPLRAAWYSAGPARMKGRTR